MDPIPRPGRFVTDVPDASEIDGLTKRLSENLTFDESGLVVAAEVFHGVGGRPG